MFTLGVTLLFIALALNATKGYIAHYVTYMTARTYLVQDASNRTSQTNIQAAVNVARDTFSKYPLESLGIDTSGLKFHTDSSKSNLFRGVTLTFEQLLSPFSIIANGVNATFHTEAMLGKEPLRAECFESVCKQILGCKEEKLITPMDNGC